MSSDSYAWQSSAELDPYFSQRQMQKRSQRNQRLAAEFAQLRKNDVTVKVPACLRKKPSIDSAAPTADDKLISQKQKIARTRAQYM